MRRLVLVAFLATACGALPVQAQSLALAYHTGDTYKYTLHTIANVTFGLPIDLDLTAHETVTVKSVDSSGTADLSIALSNIAIKSSNSSIASSLNATPIPAVDVKVAADGRILDANGNSFGGYLGLSGNFISAVLPSTAVKPGDTWSKDFNQANPVGTGSVHITTHSNYVRNESMNGINAAVVETTSAASVDLTIDLSKQTAGAPIPGMPPTATATFTIKGTTTQDVTTWVDPSGHRVIKSHMTGKTDATMDFNSTVLNGPLTVKSNLTTDLSPA